MKDFLLEMFRFNRKVNLEMLEQILQLNTNRAAASRYLSHLVLSQDKWLTRIRVYPADPKLDWWEPEIPLEKLSTEIERSADAWLEYIGSLTEEQLLKEVRFIGYDGGHWGAALRDIALQLNFHSIHHRAQIQLLIREEGKEPAFLDFIRDKYYKIS